MTIDEKIAVLENAMARMDSCEAEDIDPDFYAETLHELVELRKQRDGQ